THAEAFLSRIGGSGTRVMARLFLDANVIIDGIVAPWSLSRAVMALCARRIHKLVLAEYAIGEIEDGLLEIATSYRTTRREAERMVNEYLRYIELSEPEPIALALDEPEMSRARIICHLHDVPVLAAALKAAPDWVLSLNRKHFSDQIAARTGLR